MSTSGSLRSAQWSGAQLLPWGPWGVALRAWLMYTTPGAHPIQAAPNSGVCLNWNRALERDDEIVSLTFKHSPQPQVPSSAINLALP